MLISSSTTKLNVAQVYFYRGVLCEFGANVGRLCLALLVFSTGMFISSTAFLPSTTFMYLTLLAMGAWFHHKYKLAIFTTALSTFLSESCHYRRIASFIHARMCSNTFVYQTPLQAGPSRPCWACP